VYSVRDAARILKVKPARLRYWKRTQLVRSRDDSASEQRDEGFEFQDLVCVRAVLALLEGGVPLQRIRQSVEILRESVPELHEPLSALRVWGETPRRVVVRHDGHLLEPDGQLVLEFEGGDGQQADADVAALPRPETAALTTIPVSPPADGEPPSELGALDWFEIGCGLDSDPATYQRAIVAYRNAVSLDPEFADAHCNLGAALYNDGERAEARACFERCLELQPSHVEARFNLANLLDEEGESQAALHHYRSALRGDPLYADLHINLALLYEKLGRRAEGRDHWRRYLQIEPTGALADIARQRVSE
jgi:tetratricopeptide (TPR) repeat protein